MQFHADSNSVKIRHVDSGILPCVYPLHNPWNCPGGMNHDPCDTRGNFSVVQALHGRGMNEWQVLAGIGMQFVQVLRCCADSMEMTWWDCAAGYLLIMRFSLSKVMSTLLVAKRPEERFLVDSGASMHVMNMKEVNSEEMGAVQRSKTPSPGVRGSAHSTQVFVQDLSLFVTMQLFKETQQKFL